MIFIGLRELHARHSDKFFQVTDRMALCPFNPLSILIAPMIILILQMTTNRGSPLSEFTKDQSYENVCLCRIRAPHPG